MTLSPLMIYIIGIINDLKLFLSVAIAITCIITVCLFVCLYNCYDDREQTRIVSHLKRFVICLIVLVTISIFVPSSKTLTAMYVLPPIVNSELVQQLPADILSFVRDYLKEQTDD